MTRSMLDPRETLARIRAQADAATDGPWFTNRYSDDWEVCGEIDDSGTPALVASEAVGTDAEFIAAARTNVPRLVDALEAVLEVHQPFTWDFGYGPLESCKGCADQGAGDHDYPCPTVTAITRALEGANA